MATILSRWFGKGSAIASADALGEALLREANLVTQKCLVGYCHARTLLPLNELMKDKVFAAAYDRSRALSFAEVLADFMLIAESRLRPALPPGRDVAAQWTALYRRLLTSQPVLDAHIDVPAAMAEFERRLAEARLAPPKSSAAIAAHSGRRLFDLLPIHERLRRPDVDTVIASVRFLVMSRYQSLDRRMMTEAIAKSLAHPPGPAGASA